MAPTVNRVVNNPPYDRSVHKDLPWNHFHVIEILGTRLPVSNGRQGLPNMKTTFYQYFDFTFPPR